MTRRRKIILALIALSAFAGILFALREPDAQAVVHRAQILLAAEKTMRVDIVSTLLGPPAALAGETTLSATGVGIVIKADLDRSDAVHPASDSVFELTQETAEGQAKLSGESRRKAGLYYLHLDAAVGPVDPSAQRLLGVWAKSERPLTELLVPPSENALGDRPLDAAGVQALRNIVGAVDLFKVDKVLPRQDIGGVDCRHYAVEMDLEALSSLLLKLREVRSAAPLGPADILSVTKEILPWGKPFGEAWISKSDGRIIRLKLQTQMMDAAGKPSSAAMAQFDFSRYGQPVPIAAPQAKDLASLFTVSQVGQLKPAGNRPTSATSTALASPPAAVPLAPGQAAIEADSDGDGLNDGQEAFYGSDPWSPDTDADGWSDGLEVDKGMNPVGPGTLFGFGL
jgi:hypothetical protein